MLFSTACKAVFFMLDLKFFCVSIIMLMALVVKRLRPRIVVPICVGSNPTQRPIIKISTLYGCVFYLCGWDENLTKRSLVWVRADFLQCVKDFSWKETKFLKRKSVDTFNAKNPRQSHLVPFFKIRYLDTYKKKTGICPLF